MSTATRIISLSALISLSLSSAPAQAGVITEWGAMATMLMNNAGLTCGQVANVIEARDGALDCSLTPAQRSYTSIAQCLPALASSCEELEVDEDGDGFSVSEGDSDDTNADVYPGAEELCDGVQNDSDDSSWSLSDEEGVATYYAYDGSHFDLSGTSGEANINLPGELAICPGDWNLNLVVNANGVTIRGAGEGNTTLDASGRGSVISAANVRGLVIEDLTLTGGDATHGGGIYLSNTDATVERVTLSGNSADYDGGGLYAYRGSVTLDGATVESNTATSGGGVYLEDTTGALISTEIGANEASSYGGGLYTRTTELTSTDAFIHDNEAQWGGGVWVYDASSATFSGTVLLSNYASLRGGGLYAHSDSVVSFTDGDEISGNSSADQGGGVFLYSSELSMDGAEVINNTAIDGAGFYLLTDCYAELTDTATSGNTATDLGGGFYVYDASEVVMSGGEVSENSASSGGGLYINHATASGEDVDFIDNDPDDVYKARTSTSYTLGTGADFSY
jgi:hypothetical protein